MLRRINEKMKMLEEAERRLNKRVKPKLTEEMKAEKLRQQKLQEESDLKIVTETFGGGELSFATGIDAMNPSTEEEFHELQQALSKKVQQYSESKYFLTFAEDLVRNICVHLPSCELQNLKKEMENMFLVKYKTEKEKNQRARKERANLKLN